MVYQDEQHVDCWRVELQEETNGMLLKFNTSSTETKDGARNTGQIEVYVSANKVRKKDDLKETKRLGKLRLTAKYDTILIYIQRWYSSQRGADVQ